mgnify:CR=1 FL=1|jgi:hypothetical protein
MGRKRIKIERNYRYPSFELFSGLWCLHRVRRLIFLAYSKTQMVLLQA